MKSGKVEEKSSPAVGFEILKNGYLIKAMENKIQIINTVSKEFICFNVKIPDGDSIYKFLIAELSNQKIAVVYSCYGNSFVGIVDLINKTLISDIMTSRVECILSMPDDKLLFTTSFEACIFSIKDNIVELETSYKTQHEHISDPMVFPQKENILFLSSKFSQRNLPALKLFNYKMETQAESTFNIPKNCSTEQTLIGLPNNKIAFFCFDNKKYCQYLCIYDIDFSHFYKTRLTHDSSMDIAKYNKLFLLDNKYLVIWGLACLNPNICIQIFDISQNKFKKIKQTVFKQCEFLTSMPDGRLVSCNKSGDITFYNILPKSEKLYLETEFALTDNDSENRILPKNIVDIIVDYAGFFREKPQKIKEQQLYEEKRFHDPKTRCIVS